MGYFVLLVLVVCFLLLSVSFLMLLEGISYLIFVLRKNYTKGLEEISFDSGISYFCILLYVI